jgi:hypothetical protein
MPYIDGENQNVTEDQHFKTPSTEKVVTKYVLLKIFKNILKFFSKINQDIV